MLRGCVFFVLSAVTLASFGSDYSVMLCSLCPSARGVVYPPEVKLVVLSDRPTTPRSATSGEETMHSSSSVPRKSRSRYRLWLDTGANGFSTRVVSLGSFLSLFSERSGYGSVVFTPSRERFLVETVTLFFSRSQAAPTDAKSSDSRVFFVAAFLGPGRCVPVGPHYG